MGLEAFLRWLERTELAGRGDAARVARELGEVVRRIAGPLTPGARVLDIGSGVGAVAHAAAERGARVVALDLEAVSLQRGRRLTEADAAPLQHVAADAVAMPFRDRSFDGSAHRSVLVYLEDRPPAVAEERRVLRPNGLVSCSETLGGDLDLDTDEPGTGRAWSGGLHEILLADERAFTAERLRDLYTGAGFDGVAVESVPRRVTLEDADAVARAFARTPPGGRSARDRWVDAGVPAPLVDEFLARLTRQAEDGRPATLVAPEGFLTASAPPEEPPIGAVGRSSG
jgi:SAM-dependent methyltransferase